LQLVDVSLYKVFFFSPIYADSLSLSLSLSLSPLPTFMESLVCFILNMNVVK
jgi:hypothetical protein